MKRLIIGAAVLAAAAAALAQSGAAECQVGPSSAPAWCNPPAQAPGYGGYPGGTWPGWGNGYPAYPAGAPWGWGVAESGVPAYPTPHARTRRDRDGDGIANRYDRYPDDPRYR